MSDYLAGCNSGNLRIDPKTFRQTWCVRCSRADCDLAEFAKNDPMAYRQATWQERFFDPTQADLSIPKFAMISRLDFPDLLQKAMKLEISERRGDWSVPEINISDGLIISAGPETLRQVEDAVQQLRSGRTEPYDAALDEDASDPEFGDYDAEWEGGPADEDVRPEDEGDEDELDGGVRDGFEKSPLVVRPTARNTPDPGEVMIGGGPTATFRTPPAPEIDPWAPPPKPVNKVVKTGATIRFGSGGDAKVIE